MLLDHEHPPSVGCISTIWVSCPLGRHQMVCGVDIDAQHLDEARVFDDHDWNVYFPAAVRASWGGGLRTPVMCTRG